MNSIKKCLLELDNLELRLSKLKKYKLREIEKILINEKIFNKTCQFFKLIDCNISSHFFLTAFALRFHMKDMVQDMSENENIKIYKLIENTLYQYELLFEIDLDQTKIEEFKKISLNFNAKFTEWKKKDLVKVIQDHAKMYYLLEIKKKNLEIVDNDKNNINTKQNEILKNILKIGNNEGLDYFKNYIEFVLEKNMIETYNDKIKSNIKKIYWDKLKEDLDNKKYDSLLLNLEEIKYRISEMTPNRPDLNEKLCEFIDIKFIKQMLDHDAIDNKYINDIVNYIIDKLKEMESPIDNKKTEEWRENINKQFQSEINYSEFFSIFFQDTYNKIEKIENDIKIVKESGIYDKIKLG